MPYFPNYRKPVDRLPPDPPPAGPRPGRKPTPIPPAALDHIRTLREAGTGFEAIRAALADEFGLMIGLATLHAVWEREIEPQTGDGQQITRWRKLFGLPSARWRKILARMRQAELSTPLSAQSASTSTISNPT